MLEFKVLGPLEVERDGEPVALGPLKQRAVLSLLLMNAPRVVATDQILDAVWGEEAASKANALWVTISRLRSALDLYRDETGERILVTRDHGYAIRVDPGDIDAHRFERLVTDATRQIGNDPRRVAAALEAALALWRGDAYADVRYEDFAQGEIRRLDALHESATEQSFASRLATGVDSQLVGGLEAFAAEYPMREAPVRLLMTALYRAGRQADALKAYRRFAVHVGEELGIEPSPELRRLEEKVLLHNMGIGPENTQRLVRTGNPFKGLEVFREEDADSFFGRDSVVTNLVHRIASGDRLIMLVGASGSGKSSIVRAGLTPALRKQSLPGSDQWLISTMVPGSHPFVELESALLRSSLDAPSSLGEQLADSKNGILRAVLRVLPDDESRLVLVIDQLEELFILTQDEEVVLRFLEGLVDAVSDPRGRLIVVATLRADFYTHILESARFGAAAGNAVVNVVPLLPDELEEAALRPAELAGTSIEPALLGALISDVLGRPGSLPLFEYVLTDLYNEADGGTLTLDDYRRIGGLAGSVSNRADSLYRALNDEQRRVAKQLFLRLVTIGEGEEWGRRRVAAAELLGLGFDAVDLQEVINSFAAYRLLTLDHDQATGDPTVEVAHEALLTEWGRLRDAIAEAKDDLGRYAVLSLAVDEWSAAEKDGGYLWTGRRLDDYAKWAATATIVLTETDRAFLQGGISARRHELDAAKATQRRSRRSLLGLVAALGALAVIAGVVLLSWLSGDPPQVLVFDTVPSGEINAQLRTGMDQAERDFDIVGDRLFPLIDVEQELRAALASKPDLVVLGGDVAIALDDGVAALAAEYTDVRFVLIAGVRAPNDPPNLVHAGFAPEQGSYLVGVAAAETSEAGVVGYVGGVPATVDPFRSGFEQGARSVDPDITVLSTTSLASPDSVWIEQGLAADAAERLLAEGADVIYHAIGPAGDGVFEAVATANNPARPVWAIGVDTDQARTADSEYRDLILTSMLMRYDRAVYLAIQNHLEGRSEDFELNLRNEGVGYSSTGDYLTADASQSIDKAREGIVEGRIEVRKWPLQGVTSPPPADLVVTASFDGSECHSPDSPIELGVHDVLRIEVNNAGTTGMWFTVEGPADLLGFNSVFTPAGASGVLSAAVSNPGRWTVNCWFGEVGENLTAVVADVVAPEPSLEIRVVFDGERCSIEPERSPSAGDAARVVFENASDEFSVLAIHRLPQGFQPTSEPSVFEHRRAELASGDVESGEEASDIAVFKAPAPWAATCVVARTGASFDSGVYEVTP